MRIKTKVTVKHLSQDQQFQTEDKDANILTFGGIVRLTYQESQEAKVTLDMTSSWVRMVRESAWTTDARFELNASSEMRVISEEGELKFEVEVDELVVTKSSLKIAYRLMHQENVVETHMFECRWVREE